MWTTAPCCCNSGECISLRSKKAAGKGDKNDCFALLSRRAQRHAHSMRVQPGEIRSTLPLIYSDWLSAYINILFRHAATAKLQLIGSFRQRRAEFSRVEEVCLHGLPAGTEEEKKTEDGKN